MLFQCLHCRFAAPAPVGDPISEEPARSLSVEEPGGSIKLEDQEESNEPNLNFPLSASPNTLPPYDHGNLERPQDVKVDLAQEQSSTSLAKRARQHRKANLYRKQRYRSRKIYRVRRDGSRCRIAKRWNFAQEYEGKGCWARDASKRQPWRCSFYFAHDTRLDMFWVQVVTF